MKKIIGILVLFSLYVYATETTKVEGEKVFDKACVSCHIKEVGKPMTMKAFESSKAPSIYIVSKHLKNNIKIVSDLDDEIHRAVVIAFIKDYIEYPHLDKAMCKAMALEKFGLMPSLKGQLTKEEINAVSAWVYDHYKR